MRQNAAVSRARSALIFSNTKEGKDYEWGEMRLKDRKLINN
jgi:hypothetical protein